MTQELPEQLQPTTIKSNLIRASLFLTAFQILKAEIVERVRDFYLVDFDEAGLTYSKDYEAKVLSLDRHKFEASCQWLVSNEALTSEEVDDIQEIRETRNRIAHNLSNLMFRPGFEVDVRLLNRTRRYVVKLGTFWGGIEVSTDPDLYDQEVDYDGIRSVSSILLDYIIQVSSEHSETEASP